MSILRLILCTFWQPAILLPLQRKWGVHRRSRPFGVVLVNSVVFAVDWPFSTVQHGFWPVYPSSTPVLSVFNGLESSWSFLNYFFLVIEFFFPGRQFFEISLINHLPPISFLISSLKMDENNSHSNALKTSGIEQLKSPGVNSNYLDWYFVVKLHLQACHVGHELEDVLLKDRSVNWRDDNITVFSIITKKIESSNYNNVWDRWTDAWAMWMSLCSAHQDFPAGGRIYWLRKLVLYWMTD